MLTHAASANPFSRINDMNDCAYTLVKSGPDVDPSEVENAHEETVEVMILWGASVLHVQHLTPPRSFYVGEEEHENTQCDYLIPTEKLGTTRAPIVLHDQGTTRLVIPRGATGSIELPGRPSMPIECARDLVATEPCPELSGAMQMALPPGTRARLEVNDLVFHVATVVAGKRVPTGVLAGHDSTGAMYAGLSLLAHAGLIGAMAFFVPPMGLTDSETANREQQYLIQQYLSASAERDEAQRPAEQVATAADADNREGGTGTQAVGSEGSMGRPNSHQTNRRYGVAGPADNADPHLARAAALNDAHNFGLIGLLNTGAGGDPNAPTAPWGRDDSLGTDPISARGNMWGAEIGDAFGAGGLGLSGIGEGGGGRGEGIGLSNIGGLGHGDGGGIGQGIGRGHGHLSGSHAPRGPKIGLIGKTDIVGRLPPEVIQRIVRQNYGRFRLCYENGLRSNPNLQGRVAVRFVIGRDGAVSMSSNGGSDLPDASVVQCVVKAYYGMSFPQPEGGVVSVVYPILFTPGE